MSVITVVLSSVFYLTFLFLLAFWVEKRKRNGKSLLSTPYIYALSLPVYCTAWTFYGSVGEAVNGGIDFLTIYLGPLLMMPLWLIVVRKIIIIAKTQKVSTIADFLALRFGKSIRLGLWISLLCILATIPYIAIQFKAVSYSFAVLVDRLALRQDGWNWLFSDFSFYVVVALSIFILFFAFRSVDTTDKHEGMVAAIAAESIVKLVAFVTVGIFISYFIFNGWTDIFRSAQINGLADFSKFPLNKGFDWTVMLILSMSAIVLLPRQFQVAVAENTSLSQLKTAVWVFPLYLLAINIFVIPIALAGQLNLPPQANPDVFVILLPIFHGQNTIALIAFLGGFSAATGMVIVSTLSLGQMISNNIILPYTLQSTNQKTFHPAFLLGARRIAVLIILLLAYLYFRLVADQFSLVSIGLISFAGIFQLAPLVLGALYWKDATRKGAMAGLLGGGTVWIYTLIVPNLITIGWIPDSWLSHGPFGISWLIPTALFGSEFTLITHGVFWSTLLNTTLFVGVSLFTKHQASEHSLSDLFVEAEIFSESTDEKLLWRGKINSIELISIAENILGHSRVKRAITIFRNENADWIQDSETTYPKFVNYMERLLTSAIGPVSARILVAKVGKEEDIGLTDVVKILRESSEITRLNQQLTEKSNELQERSLALEAANQRLKNIDFEKDEFISSVTHELRTPLSGIKAFLEILMDNPELPINEKERFMQVALNETDRMTRLINQVLDLEKLESGKQQLDLGNTDIISLTEEAVLSVEQLLQEKKIKYTLNFDTKYATNVLLDSDRIKQVMINLLSNAIKHTDFEIGCIEISIENSSIDDLYWSIKDNGKGIEPEDVTRIFEKFYQSQNQNRKKPKGSGLGLTISNRIIEMHGGKISVTSIPGLGSTFTVVIPRRQTLPENN